MIQSPGRCSNYSFADITRNPRLELSAPASSVQPRKPPIGSVPRRPQNALAEHPLGNAAVRLTPCDIFRLASPCLQFQRLCQLAGFHRLTQISRFDVAHDQRLCATKRESELRRFDDVLKEMQKCRPRPGPPLKPLRPCAGLQAAHLGARPGLRADEAATSMLQLTLIRLIVEASATALL